MIKYSYVFVRMNMLPVQVAVQACHATLQMSMNNTIEEHPHLILIGVDDERELSKAENIFIKSKVNSYAFIENDMNYSLTGFATEPIAEDHPIRKKLAKYKLLPAFIHNRY